MLTIVFIFLMLGVFGKLIGFAIKAAWGLAKVILTIVLLPLILIVLACVGFMYLAVAILIVGGIVMIIKSIAAAA